MDNEIINIQFSGKEFDLILEYQQKIDADSVQEAILNAISIARLFN